MSVIIKPNPDIVIGIKNLWGVSTKTKVKSTDVLTYN